MATPTITVDEESQLQQTIEMFEVIVQSQPNDCQSLEILKEAYTKLGREEEVISMSKRIAQAYRETGQLSSAILEYETILQRRPNDADAQKSLKQIEDKTNHAAVQPNGAEPAALAPPSKTLKAEAKKSRVEVEGSDNGRKTMHKIFVEGKVISADDFESCWHEPDLTVAPADVVEPFIHTLAQRNIFPVEKSLKLLADRSRTPFLPLDKYDVDIELTRSFSAEICRRWCVIPFDRMSKAILVATANPFDQRPARELAESTSHRLLWYLVPPTELMQNIRKTFR
jgi:tetratricopeptide (TPR) repeat protein